MVMLVVPNRSMPCITTADCSAHNWQCTELNGTAIAITGISSKAETNAPLILDTMASIEFVKNRAESQRIIAANDLMSGHEGLAIHSSDQNWQLSVVPQLCASPLTAHPMVGSNTAAICRTGLPQTEGRLPYKSVNQD